MAYDLLPTVRAYFNGRSVLEGMDRHHARAFYNLYLKATPIEFPNFYTTILEYVRSRDEPLPRFGLLQEEFIHDPWKLLVVCSLLNLTNVRQVWGVVDKLFERYPSWSAVDDSSFDDISEMLRPLGLNRRRAKAICALSKVFKADEVYESRDELLALPSVGKYAADSYEIFVLNKLDVQPTDKELTRYVAWKQAC